MSDDRFYIYIVITFLFFVKGQGKLLVTVTHVHNIKHIFFQYNFCPFISSTFEFQTKYDR